MASGPCGSVYDPEGTATRPGVARSVNNLLLEDCLPASVTMQDPAVTAPTRYPTFLNGCLQVDVQSFPELRDDVIAVMRMHRRVLISMENNRRDDARTPTAANPAPKAARCFWRIAANAEATSLAAPQARPECTPIAA